MEIFLNVLLLILGFVFLAKGSDWFVDGASGIATKFKIPQLVIGLTIVAMGTSAPEAAVSISSALKGNADITIGNIVGSNILNVLIILGISATITPLVIAKDTIRVDIPVVALATVTLLLMGLDGVIVWWEGLIIFLMFISYMAYLFINAFRNKKKEEVTQLASQVILQNEEDKEVPKKKELNIWLSLLFTAIGLTMVIFGSNFVVDSATFLAKQMGISDRFIGLTVIALGTSLPELFTSVSAAMKKNADIAIGNIVGSNIFNILFIVGLSALITPVPFVKTFIIDTSIALGSVILLFLCCLKDKKLHRWSGILMLVSYLVYFGYLINLG